jgi:branched-chain amino acid transport system substrate-binding protein
VKKGYFSLVIFALISVLILCGCSSAISTSSSTGTSTASLSTTAEQPASVLKIGLVYDFGADQGLDAIRGTELLVDVDNKNGGLDIGGKKYKVELVEYDSKNSQENEVAAINRLVFEDKVKYIFTDGNFQAGWLSVTEANKIIVLSSSPADMVVLAPSTHYSFNPSFGNPQVPAMMGWYCKNYPDKTGTMVTAFIDNQFGHLISGLSSAMFKAFGVTTTVMYYPSQQTDMSAIGTKIVSLNPTTVICMGGSTNTDGLAYTSVYQAGYRGQFFTPSNTSVNSWLQICSPEVLEGFIAGMYCTETEPALTTDSQKFKELWISKYGQWTDPATMHMGGYSCLKAAMLKSNSIDTDQVGEAIASGLEFSAPNGDGKMINRLDLKNDRTVDSVSVNYMKRIHAGKAELLATIGIDEALEYLKMKNSAVPSGPPGGGPPAGK